MTIRGRDLEKGLPKSIRLTSSQVRESLAPTISTIVENIRDTINDAPPELAADIADRGIVLCGGGALIWGLPKLISHEVKMPVTVAEEALACVVLGCARLLGDKSLLEKVNIASVAV